MRKKKGRFCKQDETTLASPAYRDLKPPARALLTEFQRVYLPGRNGQLSISTRNAEELLNVSRDTASQAFYELAEHGFIELMRGPAWSQGKAREWRLTLEKMNGDDASDNWRQWKPGKPVFALPRGGRQ